MLKKLVFITLLLLGGTSTAIAESSGKSAKSPSENSEEDWFPGTSSVRENELFPRAYLGKWAPTAKDCADPDGVQALHIYPLGLDTYESGGRLRRITQSGEDRTVIARLEFEGEGRFWDVQWIVFVSPNNQTLRVWVEGKEDIKVTYRKCS